MFKDVLEYSEEELNELSSEELFELATQAEMKESLWNTKQLAEKTLINSLYGAMANKKFPLFNEDMAAAITGNGRYFIQKLAQYIEESLQKMLPSKEPYIIYGDTDSVTGDTLVQTLNGQIPIEQLFELEGDVEERGPDNYIKHLKTNVIAASVSKDLELQYKKVNYVMKHKVQKRMFKITCEGKEVIVTEDHSVMIVRDGELISAKAKDIVSTDRLIRIVQHDKG